MVLWQDLLEWRVLWLWWDLAEAVDLMLTLTYKFVIWVNFSSNLFYSACFYSDLNFVVLFVISLDAWNMKVKRFLKCSGFIYMNEWSSGIVCLVSEDLQQYSTWPNVSRWLLGGTVTSDVYLWSCLVGCFIKFFMCFFTCCEAVNFMFRMFLSIPAS